MKLKLIVLLILLFPITAYGAIKEENIEYKQGDTVLEGYIVYDDASDLKMPGVLVVHDWLGLGDYSKSRAKMLAELGYVAMAVDIYGKGVRPKDNSEAAAQATIYKSDRALLRNRIQAGLETLKVHPKVDTGRLAAIGYCFGGTTVLELARSGADIKGVVSFHGGLDTSNVADAKNIKSKVLALHGAEDPFVKTPEVEKFQKEMTDANVDWQMVYYSGAVHSFTKKAAGNDKSTGAAYNEKADLRSWEAMKAFLKEILGV